MKAAIYPGSFDPITNGHLNILERALGIFERVTVLIAINPQKTTLFSLQESIDMVSEVTSAWPQVSVDYNDGLTVDYARRHNIRTAVRGLRAVTDFEHEFSMALTNRSLWPEFDTVFLMTRVDYMYLSSSVVRQVAQMGGDVSQFVPPSIERILKEKFASVYGGRRETRDTRVFGSNARAWFWPGSAKASVAALRFGCCRVGCARRRMGRSRW
jgi:pantetheine-phosphate adenylyltransferase